MLRVPRRLVTLLLWIGIALVPLRGAATVVMPLLMGTAQTAVAGTVVSVDASMPCHGSAAAVADSPTHTCSLCDLCHSTVAQAPSSPTLMGPLPGGPPAVSVCAAPEPSAPDGLFRPPRSLLA